ncbi:UNVERIFIED_CONTAM: hypothetical protein Sindi_0358500 [Sesamum indicum]
MLLLSSMGSWITLKELERRRRKRKSRKEKGGGGITTIQMMILLMILLICGIKGGAGRLIQTLIPTSVLQIFASGRGKNRSEKKSRKHRHDED